MISQLLGIPRTTVRDFLEFLATNPNFFEGKFSLQRNKFDNLRVFYRLVKRILLIPPVTNFYRSTLVRVYYTGNQRKGTPSPIAEFRITVVSNTRGRWNPTFFGNSITHAGIVIAPQTFWNDLEVLERYEVDELIMPDEVSSSVPVFKTLDFAERLAIFYTSRKDPTKYLDVQVPNWQSLPTSELIATVKENTGDFVYDECNIRAREKLVADIIIALGGLDPDSRRSRPRISAKFNPEDGLINIPLTEPLPKEDECEAIRVYNMSKTERTIRGVKMMLGELLKGRVVS